MAPPAPAAAPARRQKAEKVKKQRDLRRPARHEGPYAPHAPQTPYGHHPGPGRHGHGHHGRHEAAVAARAQQSGRRSNRGRRSRTTMLALVITLGILIAAVVVTGTFVAGSMPRSARLPAPLLIYPVTQVTPGECPAGTKGVTGHNPNGPYCYALTDGLAIRQVTDVHVERGAGGTHQVSISLLPADRRAVGDITRRTVGRDLAFVVRGRLITAARVEMPITKGRLIIAGTFTRQAAERLVLDLKGTGT